MAASKVRALRRTIRKRRLRARPASIATRASPICCRRNTTKTKSKHFSHRHARRALTGIEDFVCVVSASVITYSRAPLAGVNSSQDFESLKADFAILVIDFAWTSICVYTFLWFDWDT